MNIEDKEIFTLLGAQPNPAVAIRDGVVVYANHAAESTIWPHMTGQKAEKLFPPELLMSTDGPSQRQAAVEGEDRSVSVLDMAGLHILIFDSPYENWGLAGTVSQAISKGIREEMAVCGANLAVLVGRAIESSDLATLTVTSKLSKALTRLERQTENCERFFRGAGMTPHKEKIDLARLTQEVVMSVNSLPLEPKASVVTRDAYMPFVADAGLIRIALLNLLSNSFKFTPPGGTITVELSRSETAQIITVSDTGSGVEGLSGVFTAFERPISLTSPKEGVGFGLSIVQKIMSLHGGWVMLEGKPGGGTSVSLRFPPPDPSILKLPIQMPEVGDSSIYLLELSDVLPAETFRTSYLG